MEKGTFPESSYKCIQAILSVYEEIIDWLSRELQLHKKDTVILRMEILSKANTALVIITCIVKRMTEFF